MVASFFKREDRYKTHSCILGSSWNIFLWRENKHLRVKVAPCCLEGPIKVLCRVNSWVPPLLLQRHKTRLQLKLPYRWVARLRDAGIILYWSTKNSPWPQIFSKAPLSFFLCSFWVFLFSKRICAGPIFYEIWDNCPQKKFPPYYGMTSYPA